MIGRMADRELFLIDGNSLAYRAFFALPDTIATSRGEPTNAIFGFASMLVKILTEYGPKATIVVWDAGMSGREQEYEPYKAERKSRPDLLRDQWPHFEPLVDAFGYENVRVEGYEADDVIASLAEQAKEAGIPVMIVTGDRDAYQLPDNGRVRVMTTSRGITDTRVYDREGVVERYGVPPELVHRLHRAEGRHLRQHPGRPGHRRQDGRSAAAAVRVARGGARAHRRHLGREAPAEPARERRPRAPLEEARDAPARHRRGRGRHRDRRPRARSLAAAGGLQPLRAARAAAPPRGGARRAGRPRRAPQGERRVEARRGRQRSRTWPSCRTAPPRSRPAARTSSCAGPQRSGTRSSTGTAETLAELLDAWGERPAGRARLEGDQPRRRAAARRARRGAEPRRSQTTRWWPPT